MHAEMRNFDVDNDISKNDLKIQLGQWLVHKFSFLSYNITWKKNFKRSNYI